ncbi:protelomerase family protein [Pantanalinema sp. GBBB05]|uniref:protelomerase family protein n=1 Tax=Pantanalinema sp. GBBB05 TaxID=2604139 RepID=UPI001D6C9102|nr:hypothetical protein [Pantanalinema sp. GBBB05]
MDVSLLHQAAAQAKTGWLEQALIDLLPQVWDLTATSLGWLETASSWAAQIDRLFEQKKLITPSQQKNRRTDIANALRTINPNHPVIPFVLLPSEVYTQLNNEQANRLNARENKFFSIQQANELVDRAIALLESDKPDAVAAGLAVLVGRRISEILISGFKPKTAYSLLFSEAVKRRGEVGMEFEIPTLAPADQVLRAIEHLKQVWSIEDLKALDLPNNYLKRRINARYSGVPHACRQHFADLVPGREAENDPGERLYTHLFRAVYAEIATYYYKPEWVPDHRFKAEIQGHFKLTEDGQKIPNYSARQNYDDYLIRDRSSGRPGVKLGLPGVEILEIFQRGKGGDTKAMVRQPLETGTIHALIYRAVDRLLFSKQWAEAVTGLVLVTGRTIQMLMEKHLAAKSGFSILIDGLEVPTLTGASQVVSAWQEWKQLELLPGVQVETAVREVCELTFENLVTLQSIQDLRAVYSAIAIHWFCPPEVEAAWFLKEIAASETAGFETARSDRGIKLGQHNVHILKAFKPGETEMTDDQPIKAIAARSESKSKVRHRRKALSVDPELLRTVATAFGIEIRGRGGAGGLSYEAALGEVLEQLAQGRSLPVPQATPTPPQDESAIAAIKAQAKTLAWLTSRMEALEQQVEQLKQERDEAIHQLQHQENSAQSAHLQLENQRLKQERDEATNKLQAFRNLLMGSGMHQEQQVEQHKTSQPIEPATVPLSTQPPIEPSEPSKPSRKRIPEDDALANIRRAIHAIMAFNNQDDRTLDDKWYISFPVVQTLLRANGLSANQKNVAAVFDELKHELDQHHDEHAIRSRHNRRHPDIAKIVEVAALD